MSTSVNKRRVIKNKPKETVSIKVSTGDIDEKTKQTKKTKKKCTKQKKISITETTKNNDENNSNQLTTKSKTKTEELTEELKNLQNNITNQKKLSIQETTNYNEEIKSKSKELSNLESENDKLVKQLKNLTNKLDNKFTETNLLLIKNNKKKPVKEKSIQSQIDLKQSEINVEEKYSKYRQSELKRYQNLLEENTTCNIEETLTSYLNEAKEKIEQLKKDIKELKETQIKHKQCPKPKKILLNKYNLLLNDYEFEKKKCNMLKSNNNLNESAKVENCKNSQNVISPINKSCDNNYNRYNNLSEKKYSPFSSILKKNKIKYIDKELEDLNLKSINNKNDYVSIKPNKSLFSLEENKVLKNLVPTDYLDSYNQRYQNLLEKVNEVSQMFQNNEEKKNEMKKQKERIDEVNLNNKTFIQKNTKLNNESSKYKRQIVEIKGKIKKINITIKRLQNIIDKKSEEGKKIKIQIEEEKEKKKSKK